MPTGNNSGPRDPMGQALGAALVNEDLRKDLNKLLEDTFTPPPAGKVISDRPVIVGLETTTAYTDVLAKAIYMTTQDETVFQKVCDALYKVDEAGNATGLLAEKYPQYIGDQLTVSILCPDGGKLIWPRSTAWDEPTA